LRARTQIPSRTCGRIGSSKTPNFRPKDFAGLSAFARAKLKRPPRRETLVAAFWKQAGLPF